MGVYLLIYNYVEGVFYFIIKMTKKSVLFVILIRPENMEKEWGFNDINATLASEFSIIKKGLLL